MSIYMFISLCLHMHACECVYKCVSVSVPMGVCVCAGVQCRCACMQVHMHVHVKMYVCVCLHIFLCSFCVAHLSFKVCVEVSLLLTRYMSRVKVLDIVSACVTISAHLQKSTFLARSAHAHLNVCVCAFVWFAQAIGGPCCPLPFQSGSVCCRSNRNPIDQHQEQAFLVSGNRSCLPPLCHWGTLMVSTLSSTRGVNDGSMQSSPLDIHVI